MANLNTKKQTKHVFVLVHGDMWGAYNANMLVKAVKEQGAKPILIVTRSTPGKDGKPLTKVADLVPSRVLKEGTMLRFFDLIDANTALAEKFKEQHRRSPETLAKANIPDDPEYLTFNRLAKKYCADGVAHYTTAGGPRGGEQILAIFDALKEKGIEPEVVLSGDTLAILPEAITGKYDCFGTHPGPLPYIKGMQGTERSLVNHMFYNADGEYMPKGSYLPGGGTNVKGCFFNLKPKLDEGPVIEEALSPYYPGMDLLQVRAELYHSLVSTMIAHLPQLMDKDKREALISDARTKQRPHSAQEIADLTQGELQDWHGDGVAFVQPGERLSPILWTLHDTPDTVGIVQNLIVDPDYFKSCMASFFPGAFDARGNSSKAFEAAFEPVFRSELDAINAQAAKAADANPDMRFMHDLKRRVARGEDIERPTSDQLEASRLINNFNTGRPLDAPADPKDSLIAWRTIPPPRGRT
jgi:hypothetical protein